MRKLLVFLAMVMISAIMFAEEAAPKKYYLSVTTDLFNLYQYKFDGEKDSTEMNMGIDLYKTGMYLGYNVSPNIYVGGKIKGYKNSKSSKSDTSYFAPGTAKDKKDETTNMKLSLAGGYFMDNGVWFELDLNLGINSEKQNGSKITDTMDYGGTLNVGYAIPITDYLSMNVAGYLDYFTGKEKEMDDTKYSGLGFGLYVGPSVVF